MRSMKKPAPAPPHSGERPTEQLWFRARPRDRKLLEAQARHAGRNLSEQITHYVMTAAEYPDIWEDLRNFKTTPKDAIRRYLVDTAKRILLEAGFVDEGGVLVPPGIAYHQSGFMSDLEAETPLPPIDSRQIDGLLKWAFDAFSIPLAKRPTLHRAMIQTFVKILPKEQPKELPKELPKEEEREKREVG